MFIPVITRYVQWVTIDPHITPHQDLKSKSAVVFSTTDEEEEDNRVSLFLLPPRCGSTRPSLCFHSSVILLSPVDGAKMFSLKSYANIQRMLSWHDAELITQKPARLLETSPACVQQVAIISLLYDAF